MRFMRSVTPLAVVAGVFGSLDTALNIAFPDLSDHFDLGVSQLQWVVVCYVLAYGGPLLAAGQLGDRFGHGRMLSIGAAMATGALALCGAAPTFSVFLAGRVLQGISTALVMASAPALVTLSADDANRGLAIGRFQTSAAVGLAAGPVLGGPLVIWGGWPAVFWFRVPLAVVLLALALTVQRTTRARVALTANAEHPGTVHPDRPDIAGGVLFTVALTGGLLAINGGRALGWTSPVVLGATAITALIVAVIPRVARRAERPLLDPSLIHEPDFLAANVLAIVSNGGMFATWLLMPGLLVDGLGWGIFAAGCCLAVSPTATAILAPIAGRRADRGQGAGLVVGGLTLLAVSMALLAVAAPLGLDAASSPRRAIGTIGIVLGMSGVGLGLGAFVVPNMKTIMGALPRSSQGVAGGLALLARTAGIVAAVATASALFDAVEPDRGYAAAFRFVYLVMAVLLAVAAGAEALRRRRGSHDGEPLRGLVDSR